MLPIRELFKRGEDCKGQPLADLRSPCNTRGAAPLFAFEFYLAESGVKKKTTPLRKESHRYGGKECILSRCSLFT